MLHLSTPNRAAIIGFLIVVFVACWPCPSLAEKGGDAGPVATDDVETVWTSGEASLVLGMAAEVVYYYTDIVDESDSNSNDQWDLYLGTLEFSMEMNASSWLKGQATVAIDDIGRKGEDDAVSISEALLAIQNPEFPLYLIGGRRTQPFGVFEDRLISGTITEDLYEIDENGATLGIVMDGFAADVSLTFYEGQNVIANLEDFGTHEFSEDRRKEEGVESYIVNVTVSPIPETLDFSIFYNREPGDGSDNRSVGGALSLQLNDFIVDAEYIAALEREIGENGSENRERAWFVGLAFQALEPLELATRIEFFDDDRESDQDGVIKNRYLAGFTYEITDHVMLTGEYRSSRYEREQDSPAADRKDEAQLQLTIEY